jgi:hypothetical protein
MLCDVRSYVLVSGAPYHVCEADSLAVATTK